MQFPSGVLTEGRTTTGRFRSLAGGWIKRSGLLMQTPSYDPRDRDTSKPGASRPKRQELPRLPSGAVDE